MKYLFLILTFLLISSDCFCKIYPNGGETVNRIESGNKLIIRWDKEEFKNSINITLWSSKISRFYNVVENLSSSIGSFEWIIPKELESGNYYRIRIQDNNDPSYFKMSESFFTISDSKLAPEDNNLIIVTNGIKIYPVPCNEYIIINCDNQEVLCVRLMTIFGNEILYIDKPYSREYVNMKNLSSGKYFLIFYLSNGKVLSEIITKIH